MGPRPGAEVKRRYSENKRYRQTAAAGCTPCMSVEAEVVVVTGLADAHSLGMMARGDGLMGTGTSGEAGSMGTARAGLQDKEAVQAAERLERPETGSAGMAAECGNSEFYHYW